MYSNSHCRQIRDSDGGPESQAARSIQTKDAQQKDGQQRGLLCFKAKLPVTTTTTTTFGHNEAVRTQ